VQLEELILDIVEEYGVIGEQEIKKHVPRGVKEKELKAALERLAEDWTIIRTKKGKYASLKEKGYVKGVLEIKRGHFGFVRIAGGDIFIPAKDLNGALNGETVLAKTTVTSKQGRQTEGKVLSICSKEPYITAGTLIRRKNTVFVVCDDPVLEDVYIPKQADMGAKNNQKVMIEITRRKQDKYRAEGRVVEILGFKDDPGVDILSIARSFNLREEFPSEVVGQIRKLDTRIAEEELKRREILFGKRIFTIDGADAKDLDDAVSIEKLKNGNWVLGVHIADVSHYVQEGSPLDKEALKRGTSVYMVDRVIPMLPKELSNGICSLFEREIRLTLSCFMEIDRRGRVVSHRIVNSAINSCHRMTYSDVNAILEEGNQKLITKYLDIYEDLKQLEQLTKTLRDTRFKKGSIDFEIDEAKIVLDKRGRPVSISIRERRTAEKLIEECMLVCNNTVAEEFFLAEMPFLYRIHEVPDAEKMHELKIFLSNFGIRLRRAPEGIRSKELQEVLQKCEGSEGENIINRVLLRSLKKARYSPENAGHFGLASSAYTHFTSPIRRYPDLIVHRIIKENLAGKLSFKRMKKLESMLPEIGMKTSERERNAIDAERKADDIKKAEYIRQFIGDEFDGVVSGVVSSAIFVELANTVEGVIPLSELKDDYYVYHRDLYCVIGERTKRRINLGDKVRIIVKDVSPDLARIEFALLNSIES